MNDERLNRLEMQFAHQDEFLSELNKVVADQQRRIEVLEKELLELRKLLDPGDLAQAQKPPHY